MMPRSLQPGQQLTAAELNSLTMAAYQGAMASGSGDMAVSQTGGGLTIRDLSQDRFFARITGAPTGAKYPFVEVVRNGDGTYTDITEWPGRAGTATSAPAVELSGSTTVPVDAIVQLTALTGGGGWGFGAGAGASLNTQNVDGTDLDATTTDIRANQATFIEFTTVGGGDPYQRLDINIAALSDGLLMDQNLTVVTSGCVELVTVQTKNESGYVTNVTVTPRVQLTTRNITLLSGSTIGPAVCISDPVCCDPQPSLFAGCDRQFPALIYVTMSAPTGTCGCFTGTFPLAWDPYFPAGVRYVGTFTGCTGDVIVTVARSGADWNVVWSADNYTFDSGTVSQFWTFVCSAVASGDLTQTVDAGSCVGGFTFSVGE